MKFVIHEDTCIVDITYQDKIVSFPVKTLKKSGILSTGKDLFYELNQYMLKLDNTIQYEIFKVYSEIRLIRDDDISTSFRVQQQEQTKLVTRLIELVNLDELMRFAIHDANILYPDGLLNRNSKEVVDKNLNVNINYFKEDYDDLVGLTLALRLLVPIWGEYIELYKTAVGNRYTEFSALQLLNQSKLYRCTAMERLRLYITEWRSNSSKKNGLANDAGVLDGISSDNLTEYLLSKLLLRKVSINNIHAVSEKESIISSVYGYLKHKLNEASSNFKTNAKYDDSSGYSDESAETSVVERYKIATEVSHGDIAFIRQFARRPDMVAKLVDKSIDVRWVDACIRHNTKNPFSIDKHNRVLAQWILANVFPPIGFFELQRSEAICLISVAQALLIHWQMYELALLITGYIKDDTLNINNTTRSSISEPLLNKLNEIYPYQKQVNRTGSKDNIAHEEIHKLMIELINHNYRINPPEELVEVIGQVNQYMSGPLGLVDMLATLLIKVHELGEDNEPTTSIATTVPTVC